MVEALLNMTSLCLIFGALSCIFVSPHPSLYPNPVYTPPPSPHTPPETSGEGPRPHGGSGGDPLRFGRPTSHTCHTSTEPTRNHNNPGHVSNEMGAYHIRLQLARGLNVTHRHNSNLSLVLSFSSTLCILYIYVYEIL